MSKGKILITGGTGQIGRELTKNLKDKGYELRWLTRRVETSESIEQFEWDIHAMTMDPAALKDVDVIIHLAGAPINGKRWTAEVKKELRDSRIKSTRLLFETCKASSQFPKHFICGSAIGYYGYDSGAIWKKENSRFGDDFLATLVKDWEAEAISFEKAGIPLSFLRTGIVLTMDGGALVEMARPVKWGLGSPLGKGDQYVSWIHIYDEISSIEYILENQLTGVFNLSAPDPVTNKTLMKTIAKVLHKPFIFPPVPKFVIRSIVGEMSSAVLGSLRTSSEKLVETGFQFKFPDLKSALSDLLEKK